MKVFYITLSINNLKKHKMHFLKTKSALMQVSFCVCNIEKPVPALFKYALVDLQVLQESNGILYIIMQYPVLLYERYLFPVGFKEHL